MESRIVLYFSVQRIANLDLNKLRYTEHFNTNSVKLIGEQINAEIVYTTYLLIFP